MTSSTAARSADVGPPDPAARSAAGDPSPARRARASVLTAQVVASLGLAAGAAAGGLLAVEVTGRATTAGAPLGFLVLGAGLSAPLAARIMSRFGRIAGLVAGYLGGGVGTFAVLVAAAGVGGLPLVLAGSALLGAGNTAVMLSRYVVADLAPPDARGRAISRSLASITVGAILGPNLLGPTGRLAVAVGLPASAGLYLVALVALFAAAAVLAASATTVREVRAHEPTSAAAVVGASAPARSRAILIAMAILTTANLTMVGIMAVTPVHLHDHGHGLGGVGVVVSLHIGAMYAASPVLGRICDRIGAERLALIGALAFVAVGAAPSFVAADGLVTATLVLVMLGVAWNVQVVAGSALLTRGVAPGRRPVIEARGELAMSLGAAGGSLLLAGPLAAAGGLALLGAATIPLHLAVVALLRGRLPHRRGSSWPRPGAGANLGARVEDAPSVPITSEEARA